MSDNAWHLVPILHRCRRVLFEWAHPVWQPDPDESDAEWRTRMEETSKTIWSLASILVASCLFCVLTLGAPDASLISSDAKISIPVAGIAVSYPDFLLLAPLFLIGLTLYLHVYIENWLRLRCSRIGKDARLTSSLIFNLNGQAAGILSGFLFYGILPAVLGFFVWKSIPRPRASCLLLFAFLAITALMAALSLRRSSALRRAALAGPNRVWRGALWAIFGACVLMLLPVSKLVVGIAAANSGTHRPDAPAQIVSADGGFRSIGIFGSRHLQLFAASLEKKNLNALYAPDADLRKADLHESDMEAANLSHSDLRKANLNGVNLTGADLTYARLDGADLTNARLDGANLRHATMDDFTQISAKWRAVFCITNGNTRRDCLQRPDLTWMDLSSADLTDSNLAGVDMTGANLSYANLTGADLTNAVLRFTDVRNARLPPSVRKASLDGSLQTPAAQLSTRASAVGYLMNRTTGACLSAPGVQDNWQNPPMTYPCNAYKASMQGWHPRRYASGSIVFLSVMPRKDGKQMCLDGTAFDVEGQKVQMWECNEYGEDDFDHQHWKMTPAVEGFVLVEKAGTGMCLHGGGTRDGSPTPYLMKCRSDNHDQQWRVRNEGETALPEPRRNDSLTEQRRREDLLKAGVNYQVSPWARVSAGSGSRSRFSMGRVPYGRAIGR